MQFYFLHYEVSFKCVLFFQVLVISWLHYTSKVNFTVQLCNQLCIYSCCKFSTELHFPGSCIERKLLHNIFCTILHVLHAAPLSSPTIHLLQSYCCLEPQGLILKGFRLQCVWTGKNSNHYTLQIWFPKSHIIGNLPPYVTAM